MLVAFVVEFFLWSEKPKIKLRKLLNVADDHSSSMNMK